MKCLIVDDEKNVRSSYKMLTNWEELGISDVIEAPDGEAGLEIALAERPEIIITDMNMTGGDGVSFLKNLEEAGYPFQIVVISGYTDFEYMRSAITGRAVDYLLKPVTGERINEALRKAIYRYKKENISSQNVLDQLILHMKGHVLKCPSEKEILSLKVVRDFARCHRSIVLCQPLFLNFEEVCSMSGCILGDLLCLKIQQTMENALEEAFGGDALVLHVNDDVDWSFLCIVGNKAVGRPNEAILQRALIRMSEKLSNMRLRVILGYTHHAYSWETFESAYEVVKAGLYDLSLIGAPHVIGIERKEDPLVTDKLVLRQKEEIKRCIYENRPRNAVAIIRDCYVSLQNSGLFSARQVMTMGLEVLGMARETLPEELDLARSEKDIKRVWSGLCNNLDSIERQMNIFMEYLTELCRQVENSRHQPVQTILAYIGQNYAQHLTLGALAQKYYMSREHLCRLLRQETGQTFTEHLTKCRLEGAIHLLQTTQMTVSDIALAVGFSDASHMNRVFQRKYGMTPVAMRNAKDAERQKGE